MIRLPPTVIVLGQSDLRDFDKRAHLRTVEAYFDRLTISSPNSQAPETNQELKGVTVRRQPSPRKKQAMSSNPQRLIPPRSPESFINVEAPPASPRKGEKSSSDEHEYVSVERHVSPENEDSQVAPRSPIKDDDFHFGGFVESPGNSSSQISSLFAPDEDDVSTPQPPERLMNRVGVRVPLPRSPLYLSQNMSASPERRPTCALTPRVISRVASHGTPGILFSEPPRRPSRHPGRSPRTLRHQTNSFSFDESERSSAAYEQERTVSASTNTTRPSDEISLREELRGSSLESSRTATYEDDTTTNTTQDAESATVPELSRHREFIFSSPALSEIDDEEDDEERESDEEETSSHNLTLPPPFSSSARNSSNTGSLPGSSYHPPNPHTSPLRADSPTVPNIFGEERPQSPSPSQATSREVSLTHQSSRPLTPARFVSRIVSSVRAHATLRSPSARHSHSSPTSVSATPRREYPVDSSPRNGPSHTPREYRVYNDDLSPDVQPQTPDHLPEARHRSRYHPAWTAPVHGTTRSSSRQLYSNHDGAVDQAPPTPSRRRVESPPGLTSTGFRGLYGGRENGDDEQSWVDGVRFDNAQVRLWESRDDGNNERSLNNTPEREDWRANLR